MSEKSRVRIIIHALLLFGLVVRLFEVPAVAQSRASNRIDHILRGLRPPITIKNRPPQRWTLPERMDALHVPGVSIAIIDGGRVIWAGGFGIKDSGSTDRVNASTLFQAQSISKAVTATAMMRLVEFGQLSLDEDVNNYLMTWRVPVNEFNSKEKVTLRRIASHSAGITVGGFGGYRLGDPIPTIVQILDGQKPANNLPVRVDTIPGSISRYSGGGYLVMQQVMTDVTGESFPSLLKRLVLGPAQMTSSTFEQPLSERQRRQAASGHDSAGMVMKGKWPIQPELAAAGLWTTPTNLAKWIIEIANAWNGRPSKLLSKKMAREMLTMQKPPFGLGLVLKGKDRALSFGHSGANLGFRAEFEMYPAVGKGAVLVTNGDLGGYLIDEIFLSIGAEYDWPARRQSEREALTLSAKDVDGLVGTYSAPGPFGPVPYEVSREGDRLFGELKGFAPKSEIFAESTDKFFSVYGYPLVFERDSSGRAVKVTLGGEIEAVRK